MHIERRLLYELRQEGRDVSLRVVERRIGK